MHPPAHDKSVAGLSKSEEIFCLKQGFRQRGSSPSLFNACWVTVVGVGREEGVYRVMEMCGWWGWCWRDGWQAGFSDIITSIRSHLPFLFERDRGNKERRKKKKTESEVCRKGLMFLLGLAYEALYTWWSTGLMGEETHRKTHPCLHARTHTRLLKMLFVVKQMVERFRAGKKGEKNRWNN